MQMRSSTLGIVTAVAAVLLLAAAREPADAARAVHAGTAAAGPLTGAEVFAGKGNCATCHGEGGTGTRMAPDLTDAEWLHIDGSYASILALVTMGVEVPKEASIPMAPRGGAALTDDEVAAVARYVHGIAR
jgi:mono/diheme cytochrome c family protein